MSRASPSHDYAAMTQTTSELKLNSGTNVSTVSRFDDLCYVRCVGVNQIRRDVVLCQFSMVFKIFDSLVSASVPPTGCQREYQSFLAGEAKCGSLCEVLTLYMLLMLYGF